MGFIPKKLVNPGLQAFGDELIDEASGQVYRGPYHSNFNGDKFSGSDPYDPNKKSLKDNPNRAVRTPSTTRVVKSPQNTAYSNLSPKNDSLIKYGKDPQTYTPNPTEQDYKRGSIQRYFAKRVTSKPSTIREISEVAYNSLATKDGDYNYSIWREFKLTWRISGKKSEVEATNTLIRDRANKNFRGIRSYLRNLIQFFKPPVETPNPSRTLRPRGEFRRVDGSEDRGPRRLPPGELY